MSPCSSPATRLKPSHTMLAKSLLVVLAEVGRCLGQGLDVVARVDLLRSETTMEVSLAVSNRTAFQADKRKQMTQRFRSNVRTPLASLAAKMTLCSSAATVIGPTPPGTGVMADAT
eukprot:8142827-Pyramimonas_sp.AAC.1